MGKHDRIQVKSDGKPCYEIWLEHSFDKLKEALDEFEIKNRKVAVITDSRVGGLYGEELIKLLTPLAGKVTLFAFEEGEANKTLDTVRKVYTHLIEEKFDRKDLLIALGGGVVGDLTGFTAATYLRGVDFIQIPTTLLSQVDSSIGGKTGVDFDSYKNMVGAFHQPRLVYMNLSVLNTLSGEQFASGMGEILKHGLIRSSDYYEWTISHMSEIEDRKPGTLKEMVYGSCLIKRDVVEEDPKEQGVRALLNFGHTIGHSVEKLKDFALLHGECVALGSVAAGFISWKRGLISNEEFFELRDMFVGFGLPITLDGLTAEEIVRATKLDKKMRAGQIRFILLRGIGEAFVDDTVTDQELYEAADYILCKEED